MMGSVENRRVIFILTHPIQYFSPLFQHLNEGVNIKCEVWYFSEHGLKGELDRQFGTNIKWDIPLLEGYPFEFIKNDSWRPGIQNGFFGLINLGIYRKLKTVPKKSIIVITGWNTFSHLYSICLAKLMGHRICLRVESPLSHEFQRSKAGLLFRRILLFLLFRCIYKFLFIGKDNKDFYRYYGVKEEDLIFTPYAVNNRFFQNEASLKKPIRDQIKTDLGIPLDDKVILYSGKLIPKKNPMDLLWAFSALPVSSRTFLVFMGDGSLRSEMEGIIRQHEIKNVLITGFINQTRIANYYSIADVYVMCSGYGETWGLSTNEAMNFGLPVILSNLTGSRSDLVNGNGEVFETNNINELQAALIRLIMSGKEEIDCMKARSLELIGNYSYEAIEKGLVNLVSISQGQRL